MRWRRIILLSIMLLVLIIASAILMLTYNPGSLRYVMYKLDTYLETEYKYISTYKYAEPTIEGIKPVIYYFEDINGVQFDVITFPPFGDYDSSQPGYPRCDYLTAYCSFNRESIEEALQCEMPINWESVGYNASYRVYVSSYEELEIIVPTIEAALNSFDHLISEKYSISPLDKFEFHVPWISVWTTDEKRMISAFDFQLIKGQPRWTRDEMLDELQRDYTEKIGIFP